jgi:hypothetical protein
MCTILFGVRMRNRIRKEMKMGGGNGGQDKGGEVREDGGYKIRRN